MKNNFLFPFVLLVVLIIWAWESLKNWFDPVTVDQISRNGKVMKFHNTSRSAGFHLFDHKYLVSRT